MYLALNAEGLECMILLIFIMTWKVGAGNLINEETEA
jgi:hypothetical protein